MVIIVSQETKGNNKMDIKKTTPPLVTGLISTALCFSLGFFNNVFTYNGLEFFYAYIAFSILLCYPMNLVAIYLEKTYPQINTHSKLVKLLTGSSKLRTLSILFTGVTIIILAIIILNITSYSLDFVDNIHAIDRLTNASLNFDSYTPIYITLALVLIAMVILLLLAHKDKICLNIITKTLAHSSLYLIVILSLMVLYIPHGISGIKDFIFDLNYQTQSQVKNMLGMAMIYAILSNFISLALNKNIISVADNSLSKIKVSAVKSILYNVVLSLILCLAIFTILGEYRTYLQPEQSVKISTIFSIIKHNSAMCYAILEVIFITFNLVIFITALKYICAISTKLHIRVTLLLIAFIIAISFFANNFTDIDFNQLFGIHLVIIYLFMLDVFLVGWVYDAQKMSYYIIKNTGTKLSPLFNIILRIVIPFVCIIVTIGYIFPAISLAWQILAALICIVIYIIKGTIFHNILNKRKI